MRRLIAIALALALVTAAAVGTAVVLLTTSTASARDRIVSAALAQKSVHYRRTVSEDMVGTFRSIAAVNADSGTERRTWFGGGTTRVRLVHDTVYVQADARALQETPFNLVTRQANLHAGQWIAIAPEDELYEYFADGLTLRSIVEAVMPSGTLKSSQEESHGRHVLVLRGAEPDGRSELAAGASGEPLPVAFSNGVIGGEWGRFGKWNEPVNVEAPASSVPIATIRRS